MTLTSFLYDGCINGEFDHRQSLTDQEEAAFEAYYNKKFPKHATLINKTLGQ
jgi:hypothetical protein